MILGLTGGIACGKSTVSRMLKELGAHVWDADAEVHALYKTDAALLFFMSKNFPGVVKDGVVDRPALGTLIFSDEARHAEVMDFVNERLHASLDKFVDEHEGLIVLDVPLLFEGSLADMCDTFLVVHCPVEVQRARVMARGTSPELFESIIARQWTNEQRLSYAEYSIDTTAPMKDVQIYVESLVAKLTRDD